MIYNYHFYYSDPSHPLKSESLETQLNLTIVMQQAMPILMSNLTLQIDQKMSQLSQQLNNNEPEPEPRALDNGINDHVSVFFYIKLLNTD